jgi:hypothetical protein
MVSKGENDTVGKQPINSSTSGGKKIIKTNKRAKVHVHIG